MGRKLNIILVLTILASFLSCKKEEQKASIVGKWKYIETYAVDGTGRYHTWYTVPDSLSHYLTFTQDGLYNHTDRFVSCNGTYTLYETNLSEIYNYVTVLRLEMYNNCNIVRGKADVSELSGFYLTIDRQGFEGADKYKYSRVE